MDPDDIVQPDTPTNVVDDVPFTDDDIAEITNDYVKNNWEQKKTTADGVVMRINDNNELEVLVIKRKRGPHRGEWALPGGIQDNETLQLFAEAELNFMNGVNDTARPTDVMFGDVTNNTDRIAMTTQFTALKELYEEVGLDTKETFSRHFQLTPKYNRYDWDARATNGVNVGGTFAFIYDNDWQPKAGDDALKAEWKTVKSILDGDTKLAFGHSEWITQILQNKKLIKETGIDKVFDDNAKYIYGIDKPDNTLGSYKSVIEKLKVINRNNKSNITQLIEAANVVRAEKGMTQIPVDRSNIQGSAESVIKNMRLGYGDPEQIQRYMQQEDFLSKVTTNYQIGFDTSIEDFDSEQLLKEVNDLYQRRIPDDPSTVFTMEDLINGNKNLTQLRGFSIYPKLSEQGIDNIARQMQSKMLQTVEERMMELYRLGFVDEVILDEMRNIYTEKIDTQEFVEYLKDTLNNFQEANEGIQVKIDRAGGISGFETKYSPDRNIFDILDYGTDNKVIDYLKTDKQLDFLSDVFGNEFMTMEPVEFWSKYGDNTEPRLNQKSSYIEDGKFYFQTNHGTPGPNENVLNFLKSVEDKYGDDVNYISIAEGLKGDRPIYFDEALEFVDPTAGRTGLIGPVLYTTTNPFVGAGYAGRSNDSTTPEVIEHVLFEDVHRFIRNYKDSNPEIVEDVINIAKENGILLDVIFNRDGSVADLRSVSSVNDTKSLTSANIANIRGSVNEENILKVNQSTLPGQGDVKLQSFWKEVLNEFDENWFQKDLENGTRFIKGIPNPMFTNDQNRLKLNDDMVPYVALQKTRVIPGATNKASLESYFANKIKVDPDYKPNFGFIIGTGGILSNILKDQNQSDANWSYVVNEIKKGGPVVGFEDQQSYKHIADTLDKYHKYFQADTSADLQLMSDYIKASLAIDAEDYTTASKLLGIDFLNGEWVPVADRLNEALKNVINVNFQDSLQSFNVRVVGNSVYKIQNDIKFTLSPPDQTPIETEWNKNFRENTRIEKWNNFYKENNLPAKVTSENVQYFVDTVTSYDLSGSFEQSFDRAKLDRKIFTMAGNNGYEVLLGTGGGRVDTMPHWVVGIIDPTNKLQTNKTKTLDVEIVNWAFLTEDDAEEFYELGKKDTADLTDSDLNLMSKYMNPDNIMDIDISEQQLTKFDEITKEKGVFWGDRVSKLEDAGVDNLSAKLMINQIEFQNLHTAHKLGQVPIEAVAASANNLLTLLAQAPEQVKANFYTGAVNTMSALNQYAKPGLKNTLKYGGKAMDKFDKWVLAPAAIDILASRMSGPGSQYSTIGGALADTMARYEDDTPDSVIEMMYGNKNNPEAKNILGVNVAYPVTQTIEAGKDKFREYVYDNNILGIKSIMEFIKPRAIEKLKDVVDAAGLNDWVYEVKRDMTVEMLMKQNNVPYTKENIDIYTKSYEENNPKEVDRFGEALPENYDHSWTSSIPKNYLATDFRVDERIRRGDRNTAGGGGSGVVKE